MIKPRKNAKKEPSGEFADRLRGFLEFKRERGYAATAAEEYARNFDGFCMLAFPEKKHLDRELAFAWLNSHPCGPAGMTNKASFMREFARYLIYLGEEAYVLPGKITAKPVRRMPHLYTREETDAFFAAADAWPASRLTPVRHLIVSTYYRLLYCTGLRPNEGRELPSGCFDLENGVISVIDSKDRRDRLVPVAPDVLELCRKYWERVESIFPGCGFFFPNSTGTGCCGWTQVYNWFWECWSMAGITQFCGPKPRIYDFRHAFATNCIRRWKADGVNVEGSLRLLQEYLGHAEFDSTLFYVHLVIGGFGDPTEYGTVDPVDRTKEWCDYEI